MPSFAFNIDPSASHEPFARAATFLASPVCVLTGRSRNSVPFAMTASAVAAVSVKPAMLSVCVRRDSLILDHLVPETEAAVHVLRASQESVAKAFGSSSSAAARLRDLASSTGVPVVEHSLARFEGTVDAVLQAGDHTLVMLRVTRVETGVGEPLIYWRRGLYVLATRHEFLASPATFEKFMAAFQAGAVAHERWTHVAHVAVAAHYAFTYPGHGAYDAMRDGILNLNRCLGIENTDTSGYHETLTRFWSETLAGFVARGSFGSSFEAAGAATIEFGSDRDLFRMYYDFNVVADRAARRTWVAPHEPSASVIDS